MALYDPHPLLAISSVAASGAPSPATSGTSLTVTSGEGTRFGSTFSFNATVCPAGQTPTPANSEIVRVSARPGSADTLTIARAQEGSSARSIVAGDLIFASVTPKVLTDLETNTEYAFSSWKTVEGSGYWAAANLTAQTYLLAPTSANAVGAAASAIAAFYLDPADFSGGSSRTTKVRVRAFTLTNATAPTISFTFGLYPITGWGGTTANYPTVTSVGTATCSVTRTTPAASSQFHDETSAVTFPAAGWFALGVVPSGSQAANANVILGARLQMQQV